MGENSKHGLMRGGRVIPAPYSTPRPHACAGSLTPRVSTPLAITRRTILPSPPFYKVGTRIGDFGAQSPCLHTPCQRFAATLANSRRMTRGHGRSLAFTMWWTFTTYPLPAFTGAFRISPSAPPRPLVGYFSSLLFCVYYGILLQLPRQRRSQ